MAVAPAALWIFSMRAVAVSGQPLLSAWLEDGLQRHRCRIMDWPSSQAAQVCHFHFAIDCETCCVLCGGGSGRDAVGMQVERFEQPLRIAYALCRSQWLQHRCCGYFRCEQREVDYRCSQRCSRISCSDIAAESRTGHLRRRPRFVIFILIF
jgi:hypothetical protein